LSGRGWGKTRTGAEWLAWQAVKNPKTRCAVVAPTFADARDTCVEGESGLLAILRRYGALREPNGWNRSMGELFLVNGLRIKLFSADEPERLRGPQFHYAWGDELASLEIPRGL
jgi:phage terminase large subunit-like protein